MRKNLLVFAVMASWFSQPLLSYEGAFIRLDMISALLAIPLLISRAGWPAEIGRSLVAARYAGSIFVAFGLLVSMLLAPQPLASVWMGTQVALGFVFWYVLTKAPSEFFNSLLQTCLKLGFGLMSAYLSVFLAAPNLAIQLGWVSKDGRLQGWSAEPNILASQTLIWGILMYLHFSSSLKLRLALTLVALITIYLAGTRTAWIGLIIFVIIQIVRSGKVFISIVFALPTIAVLSIILIEPLLVNGSQEDSLLWRFLTVFDSNTQTAVYRNQIYSVALNDLSQSLSHFTFGSGFNSFQQYHPIDPTNVGVAYLSSLLLQIFYDVGLIGFIAFAVFLTRNVLSSGNRVAAISIVAPLLVSASATNFIWLSSFWFSIASIQAVSIRQKNKPLSSTSAHKPKT